MKQKFKLNFGDYFLLYYIYLNSETSLTDISIKHDLHKSQVNLKAKGLIDKQLIKQVYKKDKYREVYYILTREGRGSISLKKNEL